MTRRVLSLAAYLLTCLALVGVAQTTPPRPYDAAREKRLEWFRDSTRTSGSSSRRTRA